jgi:hypothetical protein
VKAALTRPGEAVHAHIRALYEAVCYAIPCTDCEALAGEPCRPYRLLASRSCRPPVAVATQDPHKARRAVAWAAVLKVTESRVCQLHSQAIARLRVKLREH